MLTLFSFFMYFGLGTVAGLLGGLIGIGGGIILVPGLFYVFSEAGVPSDQAFALALGTSMAGVLFSSFRSTRAHLAYNVVRLDVTRRFALWVVIGAASGVYLATKLDTSLVKMAFAAFCLYSATRILLFSSPVGKIIDTTDQAKFALPGVFFGTICGLHGGGGANLFVPYLLNRGLDLRSAMATASSLQIPIAIAGTIGYMALGWAQQLPRFAVGYVYMPALLIIAVSSMVIAPFGVKLAHKMPVTRLKQLFGTVAAVVGLKMAGAFAAFATFAQMLFHLAHR